MNEGGGWGSYKGQKRETKTGGGMGAMGEQMVALLAYPVVFFLSLV